MPDQRAEYPALTAEKLAREELSGIWRNSRNRIIGLAGTPDAPRLTLPSITDLQPEELLTELRPCIEKMMQKGRHSSE